MTLPLSPHIGHEPTIHDVAAASGVSIRTVSRVLNKSPKVNAETRARIEKAIAALNFRPSLRARALAMGRSFLIGMVHNDRNALVLDMVQRAISAEALSRGYELVTHPVPLGEGADDPLSDICGFARRSRIDGLVVLPPVSDLIGLADRLRGEGVPAAALSSVPLEGYGAVILSQERAAAADVVHYLRDLGHRRIAMVTGPIEVHSAAERRLGFIEALSEAGLELLAEEEGDYGFASGVRAGERLLARDPRPTAIFAANDVMAAGVLKAAAARRIAVPDVLSVVGFDGSPLAEMLTPALTTVSRPFGLMAREATRCLLDLVEGHDARPGEAPALRLVEAESSGPARD